jgi:nucleoside-diphosphate-sugar epimerase
MKETINSVAILGHTGAVGGEVLKALLKKDMVKTLVLLGRRKLVVEPIPKVKSYIVDILDAKSYKENLIHVDCAICTLGVGQPSKVSKENFIQIDKNAVIIFAKACKEAGVKHFQLLGSVSSSSRSKSFYLRTKGELIEELEKLNFERLSIFQPSMILTPSNRYGLSQGITLKVWPVLDYFLIGKLSKFKGVKVHVLGTAIAENLFTRGKGLEIIHVDKILMLEKLVKDDH